MGKKQPKRSKLRRDIKARLAEPRTPYGGTLTPEHFNRTLRKVSQRVVPPDHKAKGTQG